MTDLGVAAAHITAVLVARTSMPPAEAVKEYFSLMLQGRGGIAPARKGCKGHFRLSVDWLVAAETGLLAFSSLLPRPP